MRADVVEYEQTDRRGQIALLARLVDLTDHHRQRCLLGLRDFLQATPEGVFKAYAGLVSIDDDGAFDD